MEASRPDAPQPAPDETAENREAREAKGYAEIFGLFLRLEHVVLIPLALISIAIGVTLSVYKQPQFMVGFLLGLGVICLIYVLLGGFNPNYKFTAFGEIPLVGAAAVIGAFIVLTTTLLKYSEDPVYDINNAFRPDVYSVDGGRWIPIDENTGEPIEVRLLFSNDRIEVPDTNTFKRVSLKIVGRSGHYLVALDGPTARYVGKLEESDFTNVGYSKNTDDAGGEVAEITASRGYVQALAKRRTFSGSTSYPFKIHRYDNTYGIEDLDGANISSERSPDKGNLHIFQAADSDGNKNWFFVAILKSGDEVDFQLGTVDIKY